MTLLLLLLRNTYSQEGEMSAVNTIKKIKTIRGVPPHVYNLDPKRYQKDYDTIKGIRKAKKLSNERRGYNV